MADFNFVTTWRIDAPLPMVCDAIYHCLSWPTWWEGVENVEEIAPGDAAGIGSRLRFIWKGHLPYRLTFDIRVTSAVPLKSIEGQASGELVGIGCWQFSGDGPVSVVRYEWKVRTNRRWLNFISLIAKPLIQWNHDQVMRQGGEGLARLLNARLVSLAFG